MVSGREASRDGSSETTFHVDDYFFTKNGIESIEFVQKEVSAAPKSIEAICGVFSSNLLGAASTGMAFFVFAKRSAYDAGCKGMLGSLLVGMHDPNEPSGERSRRALERLQKDLDSEWGDELRKTIPDVARGYLQTFINDEIGRDIATRMLNQCAVLVWSAFEVLAADLFVILIPNHRLRVT